MTTPAATVVREITKASDAERITFPEVVAALMQAGVERYLADLPLGLKTYYFADGGHETVACRPHGEAAGEFSAAGVEAAIRAIQRGEIAYGEFCDRICRAGCVGYVVSLFGKRAVYYGRSMDAHTEWFPGAAPVSDPADAP